MGNFDILETRISGSGSGSGNNCNCPECFTVSECDFDPNIHEICNCGGGGGDIHISFFGGKLDDIHNAPIVIDDNHIPFRRFKTYNQQKDSRGQLVPDINGTVVRPDFANNIHNAVYWYEKYANGGYRAIVLQMKEICQWPGTTVAKMIMNIHKPSATSEENISVKSPNIPMGQDASETVSENTFGATISYTNKKLTTAMSCGCHAELGPLVAMEPQWGWIEHDTRVIGNTNVIEVGGVLVEAMKYVVNQSDLNSIMSNGNISNSLDGPQGALATPTTQWRYAPLINGVSVPDAIYTLEDAAVNSDKLSRVEYNNLKQLFDNKRLEFENYRIIFNTKLSQIKGERTAKVAPTYDSIYIPALACGCCDAGDMDFISNGNCDGNCCNNGIVSQPIVPITSAEIYIKNNNGGLSKQTISPVIIPGMTGATTLNAISSILLPKQTGVDENNNPIISNIALEEYPTASCDPENTDCPELTQIAPELTTTSISGYLATQIDRDIYMAGGAMVPKSAIVRVVTGFSNRGCTCHNRNTCFNLGHEWIQSGECSCETC